MNLFLLLLSAIAMIVSIVFGFQNRGKLIDLRKTKDITNIAIKEKMADIEAKNDDIAKAIENKQGMWRERGDALAALESAQRMLAAAESEKMRVQKVLADNNTELSRLRVELDKLPEGVKPATLKSDIERYEREYAELQEELTVLEREIELNEGILRKEKGTLERQVTYQAKRTDSFDVNSLEATVTAVDRAWGFAVINAGSADGVTQELDLLVVNAQRQPKAKLNIIQLEGNKLVANIDYKSAEATGQAIRAGDRVILRKPNTGGQ